MFTGSSHRDFYKYFESEEKCKEYLFDLKWKSGYLCRRCGHDKYWSGATSFHTRCCRCDYDESFSCNSVFHKIKFPLLTAFGISFQLVVLKKGRSSLDLSREFKVQPATIRLFRKKIQFALKSALESLHGDNISERDFVMDSVTAIRDGKLNNGFQRINLCISSRFEKKEKVRHLKCHSFLPNREQIAKSQLTCGKFKEENPSLLVWNLKTWITGILHHCSAKNLQGYIHESFFRLNHRNDIPIIWHTLMTILMSVKPDLTAERGPN